MRLAATENRFSGKSFPFDQNFTLLTQKSFYIVVLPSNDFRSTHKREREPQKEKTHANKTHSARERENNRRWSQSWSPELCRSASIAISRSRSARLRSRSHRENVIFFGFYLCSYEWMILCIRLVTEKMWATSRKCVFYGIFKNTTKHQKIFSETFFEMQPNTWKHFIFRKIAFLENIYFPEILLHEPNAA